MDLGQPIARGNTADIYLCEGKAVKLFHDRLPDDESEYEANKQRLAYACGLPVPRILDVSRIGGRQAIVMEYVAGPTIGAIMRENAGQIERCLALSVDIQLRLHSTAVPGLEPMKDKLARQLRTAMALDAAQRAALLERLDILPSKGWLCHGDYHVFNLIQSTDRTVVIDWVDSSAGDPCADAYRTYLLYSQFFADWAELYLRLYCDRSGCSQEDIFAWAPVIAGARLSEHVASESAVRLLEIVALG